MAAPASTSTPFVPADFMQTDVGAGTAYSTGDLRRAYAFGDRVSDLSIGRDTLFRVLSKLRKKPAPDSIFKVIEERSGVHRRYAYAVGHRSWTGSGSVPTASYTTTGAINALTPQTAGSFIALQMGGDYAAAGNINNVFRQATGKYAINDSGTCPVFFYPGQVVKVNTKASNNATTVSDYFLAKILSVETSGNYAYIGTEVTQPLKTAANYYLASFTSTSTPISDTYAYSHGVALSGKNPLEDLKTYVVGSAFAPGSSYPNTYSDAPYSTKYGFTQIFKTTLSVSGTAAATEYKIVPNERARLWAMKIQQHNWDIADALYWSGLRTDSDGAQHMQGIVNFVLNNGNIFTFTKGTTTRDDILDDMCELVDPRYNNLGSLLFLCSTDMYQHLHKFAGFPLSNIKLGYQSYGAHYTFDFSGSKMLADSEVSQFSTLFGTMNVARDIHLDGSNIKMIGVDLNKVFYRPLVGNGINRDTTIYLGVQKLETTGVDATVDLIQTEAGVEITGGQCHAVWT